MAPPLSVVESHRIAAIVEDAVEKLTFLETITPDVLQHRDELSKFVGDEISRIIMEQRQLEQRYESLIAQRGALKGLANKSKYKEVQSEIQDVSRALRESTKNLSRNLKDNPNISGNLLKIQRERLDLINILRATLRELAEKGSFGTLVDKVSCDKAEQDKLNDIFQREREMSEAVKQYDKDLNLEKVEHQRQVTEQNAAITLLKQQLQSVRSKTSMNAKYFCKEAHARTCSVARTCRQAERARETQTAGLERRREIESTVHLETVNFLKVKQNQLLEDLADWESKYERDSQELDGDLERLTQERVANLERLTHLKKRRADELEQEKAAREHKARQGELDKYKHAENTKKHAASLVIQNAVRAFLARKAEDDAKRANDKKKKKGGKKKK